VNSLAILSIIFMFLALLFYSISIWGVRVTRKPKFIFVILSWAGFVLDTSGTIAMALLAGEWHWNLHGVTGVLAILAMMINSIWITLEHRSKQPEVSSKYLKFSLIIWIVWLVSFLTGTALAMK
jgi:uncharacterized repeat protein (TIGR03987 family)